MHKKVTYIGLLVLLIFIVTGCSKSGQYSVYNPKNKYAVGNSNPIRFPSDIKLRKAHTTYYYVEQSRSLPRPIPSLLPPGSEALRVFIEDEDRVDMPYYERFPRYPMPK